MNQYGYHEGVYEVLFYAVVFPCKTITLPLLYLIFALKCRDWKVFIKTPFTVFYKSLFKVFLSHSAFMTRLLDLTIEQESKETLSRRYLRSLWK